VKKLWYQIDISDAGYEYMHANVLIFQSEGDIEDVFNPDPVITWQGQCNRKREEADGDAFVPQDLRYNSMRDGEKWGAWYGNNMSS
jgi:hypothetical protein